jgi:iron complex outermembrane receptor protein
MTRIALRAGTALLALSVATAVAAQDIQAPADAAETPASTNQEQAGASPLYGSDAIAGVVNIITVAQQEGLRASAQYGAFRQGDGDTFNADISYGVSG